jgi:hypothetical protein
MDHYHKQQQITQAQQAVWANASEQQKDEMRTFKHHLIEMMATDGWLWLTKYFKVDLDQIDRELETAKDMIEIYRNQGAILFYKRMMSEINCILNVVEDKKEETNGN